MSANPISDPLDPSDDFNVVGGEIFAAFRLGHPGSVIGNPFAPTAMPSLATVAGSAATQGDPGSFVAVTSGGITINLIFDAAAMAAPASFRAGIQQAASILAAAISDKITVNIKIDYSGTGGGAAAGPDHGQFESYSSIRADLINNATPGDTTFNALPAGSSIQGQSSVAVWNAQLKLWGLMGANDTTTDDGSATFATDINPNLLVGVALHELTHAMGRVPYGHASPISSTFSALRARARGCFRAAPPPRPPIFLWTAAIRNWPTTARPPIPATSSIAACRAPTIRSTNSTTAHVATAHGGRPQTIGCARVSFDVRPTRRHPRSSTTIPCPSMPAAPQTITSSLLTASRQRQFRRTAALHGNNRAEPTGCCC